MKIQTTLRRQEPTCYIRHSSEGVTEVSGGSLHAVAVVDASPAGLFINFELNKIGQHKNNVHKLFKEIMMY